MGLAVTYETDTCPLNTGVLNVRMQVPTNKGLLTYQDFVNSAGRFAADCLVASANDKTVVCSLDTTLTPDKIEQARLAFILSKTVIHNVSMY